MVRIQLSLLAALSLAACLAPQPRISVESEEFPGVRVECDGEAGLSRDGCRAWAEELLSGPAIGRPEAVRLLKLTFRTGNSRCAADFFGANGRLMSTVSAVCPPAG
jgi:hypothetical protein